VIVGTRVPVRSLFDYLEGGESIDEFLRQFPSVKREFAIAMGPKSDVLDLTPISRPTVDIFDGHSGILLKRWGGMPDSQAHGSSAKRLPRRDPAS
jgi:hypothetical protein